MSHQLTAADAKQSLEAHVETKGIAIREKYGPHIGWKELLQILSDRAFVRYPCEIVFESGPLQKGELAYPSAESEQPMDGYTIYVHPYFALQLERVVAIVLYQLVLVNYGDFVSANDAETFGASALGISKDEYYQSLCEMADEISGTPN